MIPERLRQRLEELHRPSPVDRSPDLAWKINKSAASGAHLRSIPPQPPQALPDDAIPVEPLAGEELTTVWGNHWLVRHAINTLWPASRHYLPIGPSTQSINETTRGGATRANWPDDIAALRLFPTPRHVP